MLACWPTASSQEQSSVARVTDGASLPASSQPDLLAHLGPPGPGGYAVREVGDGNINFVWILQGAQGALVLKQSLPFVRCVGESWPLTQVRPLT